MRKSKSYVAVLSTSLTSMVCPIASADTISDVPIVPTIAGSVQSHAKAIYATGQAKGNRSNVFAKIGDSITESGSFLQDIGCGEVTLAGHAELSPTIDFFRGRALPSGYASTWCGKANSFTRASASATAGWDTRAPLAKTTLRRCPPPNNRPMRCEYHLLKPAFALIMYGTNDLERVSANVFKPRLKRIVDQTAKAGIVPVLSTIPPRRDSSKMNARVASFNQAIVSLAAESEIPLWNYWRVMSGPSMVNQGLDSEDGVHPNVYGGCHEPLGCASTIFSAEGLRYGYNQRNFTALQVLAELKRAVIDS